MLRGLCFGIVDEADSVLADEARTPLILTAGAKLDDLEEQVYPAAVELARTLEEGKDYDLDRRERRLRLTDVGEERLERLTEGWGGIWSGPHRRREFVSQALSGLHAGKKLLSSPPSLATSTATSPHAPLS